MPCYHPLPAWYAKRKNESGKRSIVFNVSDGLKDRPVEVPCGRCLGCKLEYSRQWAVRCLHESKLHDANCFVTLTYENVPPGGSLRPRDFVLFMKRLRLVHPGVRFFQCGEYGEKLGRPHHHAILFNCHFPDSRFWKEKAGVKLSISKELDSLWGHGQCSVGAVSFESAAYVARYTMKKVHGGAEEHYAGRLSEYCTMSRRPGIGSGFFEKFRSDVYPRDEVIVRGVACRPPRYYDSRLEIAAPSALAKVKAKRRVKQRMEIEAAGFASEYKDKVAGELVNARQLKVSEIVKTAAISTLTREIEYED